MFHGIDHIVLYVTDIERTIDWYHDLFGFAPEGIDLWRAGTKPFASVRVNPTLIIDFTPGTPNEPSIDHIALATTPKTFDAFVTKHADLIEMGPAKLSGAQGNGDGLYLRDPDNHRIELRTYR